jgi:outer membrane lipoprotein SlyB
MKKFITILTVFLLSAFQLNGCASVKSQFDFQTKEDKGMFGGCLSGVVIGGIASGNVFGALLGGMVGTAFGAVIGQHFDKKVASREDALLKYALKDDGKKLFIENSSSVPDTAVTGSTVNTGVQYSVLAPADIKQIKITETRMLFNEKEGWIKLAERQVVRTQGTYSSVFSFTIPKRISKGDAVIVTIISNDKQTEKILSPLKIS